MSAFYSKEIFSRNRIVFGEEKQKKIENSYAIVIGLGGVGGFAAEFLVRCGIGSILLVDFDCFEMTNINRQNYSNIQRIGKKKIHILKKEFEMINPDLNIEVLDQFVKDDFSFLRNDNKIYVIDAIDAFRPKINLIKYCWNHQICFISCLGAGGRMNPDFLEYSDLFLTEGCPFASRLRKFLRREGVNKDVPVVYSKEKPSATVAPNTDENKREENYGRIRNVIGSLPFVPAVMGAYASFYIIRKIIEQEL